VAQCKGTTKKGERCKREAPEGAAYCSIHQDQAVRERTPKQTSDEWDRDAILATAIGFALVGAILFFRIRR
jgi:hypothetical protein